MLINKDWLEYSGACEDGIDWFERRFGESAVVSREELIEALMNVGRSSWAVWVKSKAPFYDLCYCEEQLKKYRQSKGRSEDNYVLDKTEKAIRRLRRILLNMPILPAFK